MLSSITGNARGARPHRSKLQARSVDAALAEECRWRQPVTDRGNGDLTAPFLAADAVPDSTDTAAMPPAGQSALWKYKAIYRQDDDRTGQWSDVVSIPVAG